MIDITWTGESSSKQTWQKIVATICRPCVLRRLKQGRIPTNKSSFLEKLAACWSRVLVEKHVYSTLTSCFFINNFLITWQLFTFFNCTDNFERGDDIYYYLTVDWTDWNEWSWKNKTGSWYMMQNRKIIRSKA